MADRFRAGDDVHIDRLGRLGHRLVPQVMDEYLSWPVQTAIGMGLIWSCVMIWAAVTS